MVLLSSRYCVSCLSISPNRPNNSAVCTNPDRAAHLLPAVEICVAASLSLSYTSGQSLSSLVKSVFLIELLIFFGVRSSGFLSRPFSMLFKPLILSTAQPSLNSVILFSFTRPLNWAKLSSNSFT